VLAASRFEGGTWVRVGFLLTYGAFGYGCVVVGLAAARFRDLRLRPSACGLLAAVAIASLALPAIEFPAETLNGFQGLDLLSVIAAVALAGTAIVSRSFRAVAALCLAGILAGNLLIQHFTTRGSTDRYGLAVATVAAVASTVCGLLGVRGSPEARR
jgi:hypothetical protein